ncbi:ABC transporter permease [Bogoriella caseilytica]|uniref:Autoinducer 2 import system permease protein LsrD n=1 Tax=Bogoriella caseilytica TaxID=56055 RepID=A0A3N2BFE3_9MICO|nr:ABC transporter permease [Bogoriella caseilytica]ROR73976.1 monosaccharide ABC transporter membrane protein (CUT2 family) [Bogoriella caseilytica]
MTTTGTDSRNRLQHHEGTAIKRFLRTLSTPGGAIFVLALVLLAAIIVANPSFGEPSRLMAFVARSAPIMILAFGQYFVIVSGEFDLSVGALVSMQAVIAGNVILGEDDLVRGIALMIAVGLTVGLVNGVATTWLKVPSFIVTLGTMLMLSGLALYVSGGAVQGRAASLQPLFRNGIEDVPLVGRIPYPVLILLAVSALVVWLMRRPYGRTLIAAGDNPEAARLAGAHVGWIKTRAFIISALAATLAALLLVSRSGASPSLGDGLEFQAITAVVLGGVVLGGGRGWVLSAGAGAFALELMFSLLNFLGVQPTWRPTVQGVIIILAVAAAAKSWGSRRRSRAEQPDSTLDPEHQPDSRPHHTG